MPEELMNSIQFEIMRKTWADWLWGLIFNYAKTHSKVGWSEIDEKMWNQIQYMLLTWTPSLKGKD